MISMIPKGLLSDSFSSDDNVWVGKHIFDRGYWHLLRWCPQVEKLKSTDSVQIKDGQEIVFEDGGGAVLPDFVSV